MKNYSAWLDEQQEVLDRDFTRVRHDIISRLKAQLERQDEEHQIELKKREEKERVISERLNDEYVKNARLTEENSILLHRLERLDQRKSPATVTPAPTNQRSPLDPSDNHTGATVSKNEYHDLIERFQELHKTHHEAMQHIRYLERKNVTVMQKNKEMKESVRAWQRYSDRNYAKKAQAKQKGDPTPLAATTEPPPRPFIPSSPVSSIMKSPPPLHHVERHSPKPINLAAPLPREPATRRSLESGHHGRVALLTHDHDHDLPHLPQPDLGHQLITAEAVEMAHAGDDPHSASPRENLYARITSSQTEYEENEAAATLMPPPPSTGSENAPEIVSERSLKRKRKGSTAIQIQTGPTTSEGTPRNPVRVKEEPLSSPPAPLTVHKLLRNETYDLDELGPRAITTPRRKRFRNPTRLATLRHQRSTSEPFVKEENHQEVQGSGAVAAFPASMVADAVEARAYSEPAGQDSESAAELQPLRPLDLNTRLAAQTDEQTPFKRRKRDAAAARHLEKFNILTESGEEPPPMHKKRGRLTPESARAKINQKIRAAKQLRTPANAGAMAPVLPPSDIENVDPTTSDIDDTPVPPRFAPVFQPDKRSNSEMKPSVSKQAPAQPPTRLRHKPVDQLKLSDFKANPQYNQGYSYAFAETVRTRADRACLPGCTREECCGSAFRSLADAAAPLSPSQEEALLEDHLGDAYDTIRLSQMTPEERRELVLQARTREFANKYGRHRQAYERHNTPPGFWRVDFPSTQEEREDVEKAMVLERKVVEERRAEAMRRGGRWVFRDE